MTVKTVTTRGDFLVELVDSFGSDEQICQAARVSTVGAKANETKESKGLINFLMRGRHGSPFEHGAMTFRITAPIMVWREFMRHRIGFSYNEQSGRYMQMLPVFYLPMPERPLVQAGKPGQYQFVAGTEDQYKVLVEAHFKAYDAAWNSYITMIDAGIANEVARTVLPVGLYSSAYVTCNPRSMMSFLSLRTKHDNAKFPSFPQWEINWVADQLEEIFRELFPLTHDAFHSLGRVSP